MAKDTFFVQSGSLYIIQGDNFVPSSSISFSFEDPTTDLDSSDGMFASGSVNAGITRSHIITSFHPELSASGILEIDPNKRPDSIECLNHPWLQDQLYSYK